MCTGRRGNREQAKWLRQENPAALLRHQLFVYRDLFAWLNAPFEGPPQLADAAKAQLTLGITS
jgi:hypothetical protein